MAEFGVETCRSQSEGQGQSESDRQNQSQGQGQSQEFSLITSLGADSMCLVDDVKLMWE